VVLEKTRTQIKLSREQELKIKHVLIRAWQTNDREDNKGALEIVETYEKVAKLSERAQQGTGTTPRCNTEKHTGRAG
jgi:hypothetical protein